MATRFYTATSLDGFLATDDDSVDWLDALPQPSEDTYAPFIETVGAICMGSATFEFLERHMAQGNPWPYQDHPVCVFTSKPRQAPEGADVRFASGDVPPVHAEMVAAAETAGKPDVWVCGGGGLAAAFLEAGLLDELILTVAASTLGSGKPLLPTAVRLRFTSARMLGEGFVELRLVPERVP
ncbi:MAG: dihydrofolate reductase family protein [Thermoplasmatota archaeon]